MAYFLTALHKMVRHVFSGRVVFHDGCSEISPGVTVHRIGGHSRGLQYVRVRTWEGWLTLASDAAHYYENSLAGKPDAIVFDLEDMLSGFATIRALSSAPELTVPGHDPLVRRLFPSVEGAPDVFRLDATPQARLDAGGSHDAAVVALG